MSYCSCLLSVSTYIDFLEGKESCCFHLCIFLANMMHGLESRATASPYHTSLKFRKCTLLLLATCRSAGTRLGQLTASSYEEKAPSPGRATVWQEDCVSPVTLPAAAHRVNDCM